jgi:UDP-N-acetylmuramate--alanine ligase
MQAHRYTRLASFLCDFAKVLELSDGAFITPIYSAGEQKKDIDHFSLIKKIKENGIVKADFVQNAKSLKERTQRMLCSGDFVIFLGAGDITQWAYEFADLMESEKMVN